MKIHELSASDLKRRLDAGELSSVEIVDALRDRTVEVDGRINAMVVRLHEQARREAEKLDRERARGELRGPLHGIPLSIKEHVDVAGTESTMGIKALTGQVSREDAVAVRLARESGAFVIGKTNVPQTMIAIETTNHIYGTTHNPWDHRRTPGGSSGGEGAAIASGQSPAGFGTDVGGSIRIPASYCGIAGLKPTVDRWSNRGSRGWNPGQEYVRAQIGPMARTVEDVNLLMQALDSPRHSPYDPNVPPLPVGDPAAVDLSRLRVGIYEDDGFFTPASSVQRAVREAADALRNAGAEVVQYVPHRADEHYGRLAAGLSADGMEVLREVLDGEPLIDAVRINARLATLPRRVLRSLATAADALGEKRLAGVMRMMGRRSVRELRQLTAERTDLRREEMDMWRELGLDLVICPATATPAPQHGTTGEFTIAAVYTIRYNLLDLPAGVVPVSTVRPGETTRPPGRDRFDRKAAEIQRGTEGLPLGVQVVGRPWREAEVLAAMSAIERDARARDGFPLTPVDPR